MKLLPSLLAASLLFGVPAAHAGDAAKGEKMFNRCKACHTLKPGKRKQGPHLENIVGRDAGSVEDYKYSPTNLAAADAGLVWTEENLIAYLEDPQAFLEKYLTDAGAEVPSKKTKMRFKLKKEGDRADLVAYLASLSN